MQRKRHSAVESVVNVAVGYFIGIASQMIIFPIVGIKASLHDNVIISVWFTVISLIRSYIIRRAFARKTDTHA